MPKLPLLRNFAFVFRELGGPIVLGCISLVTLVFVWIGAEMGAGETRGFDSAILLALRQPGDLATPIGPQWLKLVMIDLTALGGGVVLTLVALVVIGALLVQRKRAEALFVAVALGGGGALGIVLKSGYGRPRPDVVTHLVEVTSLSFPSGHAMNSAVVYLTLATLLARTEPNERVRVYLLVVAISLALLVGVSRVYLGVHWPSDVVAGWCLGAFWATVGWIVLETSRKPAEVR